MLRDIIDNLKWICNHHLSNEDYRTSWQRKKIMEAIREIEDLRNKITEMESQLFNKIDIEFQLDKARSEIILLRGALKFVDILGLTPAECKCGGSKEETPCSTCDVYYIVQRALTEKS